MASAVNQGQQNCALTFSPLEDIDYAFYNLSSHILNMIADMIRNRYSAYRDPDVIITFTVFYCIMAQSIFWNFLDIRMLEAIAIASMIPAAQTSVENYKRAFFNKKLSEIMKDYQNVLFIRFIGDRNEYLCEYDIKNYDCHQMTIGDFHKHRLYLETSLFHVGAGTFAINRLSTDNFVQISWQIHIDLIDQIFYTLNDHEKIVQNIAQFSVSELERWKNLPVLLRGQEKKVGPIELLEHTNTPYSLMKGYFWAELGYDDIKEIAPLNEQSVSYCLDRFCRWVTLHPFFKKHYFIAVRSNVTYNHQLVGFSLSYPFTMQFGKISKLPVICLKNGMSSLYYNHQILNTLYKEAMRIANLHGISQAVFPYLTTRIIKPFTSLSLWMFHFAIMRLPHSSIQTPGWRRMKKKDISSALALANKYTSQFKIRQVFTSKSEFSHYLFCPSISDYISTYVVEDRKSGNITDMIGYRVEILNDTLTCAHITTVISTKTPVRQLLVDLLLCVKQTKAKIVQTLQFGLKEEVFTGLFYRCPYYRYWYPYNFSYPEVSESQVYVFGFY